MTNLEPARVTLLHTAACHFCDDARGALAELARQHRLRVELVEAGSPAGQALLGEHRAGMFPVVLVDGRFFSAGRLPRRKLARLLAQRAVPGAEAGEPWTC